MKNELTLENIAVAWMAWQADSPNMQREKWDQVLKYHVFLLCRGRAII